MHFYPSKRLRIKSPTAIPRTNTITAAPEQRMRLKHMSALLLSLLTDDLFSIVPRESLIKLLPLLDVSLKGSDEVQMPVGQADTLS